MSKPQTYQFFDRRREGDGLHYDLIATHDCDSDQQAELMVNHLRDDGKIPTHDDGREKLGLTIRRAGAEWYSTGF